MADLSLPDQLAQCTAQGLRPGVALGAFGLIHAGTIEFLRRARTECDCLFVAIAPDAGPSADKASALLRPEERLRVLGSFAEVDAVGFLVAEGGLSVEALHDAAPEAAWFCSTAENDVDAAISLQLAELGVNLRGLETSGMCTTAGVLERIARGR